MKMDLHKILVIDDDEAVLFAHEEVLSDFGFDVTIAQTFERAVDLISNNIFLIIVTDLNLSNSPEFEGFEIIKLAKKNGTTKAIIVVSAYSDYKIKQNALNAGADYFLEKPVSSNRLKLFFDEKKIY